MASPDTITVPQLSRLMGLPEAPTIIDVRTDEDFARDPRILPGSLRRDYRSVTISGRACRPLQRNRSPARHEAQSGRGRLASLEGRSCRGPGGRLRGLVHRDGRPTGSSRSPGRRATRRAEPSGSPAPAKDRSDRVPLADPSIHRPRSRIPVCRSIGCPRRRRALRCDALDIEGVFWSHRGPLCTFDEDRGIRPALERRCCVSR